MIANTDRERTNVTIARSAARGTGFIRRDTRPHSILDHAAQLRARKGALFLLDRDDARQCPGFLSIDIQDEHAFFFRILSLNHAARLTA